MRFRSADGWRVGLGLGFGLLVLLMSACTDNPLDHYDSAIPLEVRAADYCQARADADWAISLYRTWQAQLDTEDGLWLRERLGGVVARAVALAIWMDPRSMPMPSEQEPQRPELIAMVCERCPERVSPPRTEASPDDETDVFVQHAYHDTPICEPADVDAEAAVGSRVWRGMLILTELRMQAGPVVCEPPTMHSSGQCRHCLTGESAVMCDAQWVDQALPALMLPYTDDLAINVDHDGPSDDRWWVAVPLDGWQLRQLEQFDEEAGVVALELDDGSDDGRWHFTGSVSRGDSGLTAMSGTFTGTQSMAAFIQPWYAELCADRCGVGQPGDLAHFAGTWTVTEQRP